MEPRSAEADAGSSDKLPAVMPRWSGTEPDSGPSETAARQQRGRVWTLRQLLILTRPSSTPGILAFFLIGTYLAAQPFVASTHDYWRLLLSSSSLGATLLSVILVSAGSMVVNDLEDLRLGRDSLDTLRFNETDRTTTSTTTEHTNPYLATKPLVNHSLSTTTARTFLYTIYATTALVAVAVPGPWTRLAIGMGVLVTHYYTQYFKPMTWVKNLVCAGIIAMGPITSGLAMLELLQSGVLGSSGLAPLLALRRSSLPRVAAVIFFGVLSRELMMDCNDVWADRRANVKTVPVVHGNACASRVAMLWSTLMATCVLAGPVTEVLTQITVGRGNVVALRTSVALSTWRRLGLALLASGMFLRRSWNVMRTRGQSMPVVDAAVNEGLLTVLIGLASFV